MGKVRKTISKLIPNEAKPFLPYLATMIPGGALGIQAFAASNPLAYKALIAGATKGLTDDDAKLKDIARTSAFAVAPDLISEGLGTVSQKYGAAGDSAETFKDTGVLSKIANYAGTAKQAIDSSPYYTLGAQTGADATVKQIELNAEALDKYNADLLAQGIGDKAARRSSIFKIFQNAGYNDDDVNTLLDKYSYAGGGRVGFARGGGTGTYDEFYNPKKKSIAPKEGIESIQIDAEVDEDNGREKMSIEDIIKALKGEDSSIKDGLKYATEGLSMLNESNVKPTPMMRLGFEKGGFTKKEGILSVTDSNEGGMGGVMYSDEKGNPITKEQAMELFNKQAEEENKIKDFLNVKRKENEPKFEYNLEDFNIKRTPPKVVIMNENGETQIIDEDLAKKLNANIIMNSFDTEAIIRQEAKAKGGRIGYEGGGTANLGMELYLLAKDKFESMGYSPTEAHEKALEMSGIPSYLDERTSTKKANGGIIGLMNGGQPVEMDYRMGGMIPIGSKERADDVPARLSKNEFVMTADAVRAAGGGSVNEGAKRMYELMNNLEAKV